MRSGMFFAATAYILWGLFPLYFKLLQSVPAQQILMHRIIWSLAFVLVVLAWRRQWQWLPKVFRQPKVLLGFGASALLLSTNWLIYILAVNSGRVVDASLGYFITPLVSVLFGYLLLKERLRPLQWGAIALAAAGVVWLTWHSGQLPWIGLALAASFGTYGLLRKTAVLGPLEGLTLETLLLFPLALGYLTLLSLQEQNAFHSAPAATSWLLAAGGPITAIPLLLFAAGARRIPLSTLGFLQYITPTLQLLFGVWLYHEPFSGARLIGFATIWTALALYSMEGLWQAHRSRQQRKAAAALP
ncbi:MAG: EamA family transporter RarD [Burkholderiaceae bacterium]